MADIPALSAKYSEQNLDRVYDCNIMLMATVFAGIFRKDGGSKMSPGQKDVGERKEGEKTI